MKRFLTLHAVCFAIAVLLLIAGQVLLGVGFALAGLILHLESRLDSLPPRKEDRHDEATDSSYDESPPTDEEPESFALAMTEPWMEEQSGWDTVDIYPSRHRYERSYCFGGPPTHEEVWEYAVKEGDAVFQRLLDRREHGIYEDQYEIVNGCIQEDVFERKDRQHQAWLRSQGDENLKRLLQGTPAFEAIARCRREILWHELHGALRVFILLSNTARSQALKTKFLELRESFSRIAVELSRLGATRDKHGTYKLPAEADDSRQKALRDLLSSETLLKQYGIRSSHELTEQDQILKLLSQAYPAVQSVETSTKSSQVRSL
jgi:hypothetical protein